MTGYQVAKIPAWEKFNKKSGGKSMEDIESKSIDELLSIYKHNKKSIQEIKKEKDILELKLKEKGD